jgi:hypothetical protein
MVSYGCPEVFGWCPSHTPFLLKFYTYNADLPAGIATIDKNGDLKDSFVIRSDTSVYGVVCESK